MLLPALPTVSLLFEHPLACITHVPQQVVRVQWLTGLRDASAVQTIFDQLVLTYKRTACPKLLIDERLARPFKEDAKHWLIAQELPLLAHSPAYSRVAIVRATEVYTRLSTVPIQAASQGLRLPCRTFDNEAEALAWLTRF